MSTDGVSEIRGCMDVHGYNVNMCGSTGDEMDVGDAVRDNSLAPQDSSSGPTLQGLQAEVQQLRQVVQEWESKYKVLKQHTHVFLREKLDADNKIQHLTALLENDNHLMADVVRKNKELDAACRSAQLEQRKLTKQVNTLRDQNTKLMHYSANAQKSVESLLLHDHQQTQKKAQKLAVVNQVNAALCVRWPFVAECIVC